MSRMPAQPAITAYTLTYNEAHQIREVFESIKWTDEWLVVDSFSTDGTVQIAREYGARVLSLAFNGFGALRNAALDAASHDWMVSIDADERCTPELAAEIRGELASPRADAYLVPRKNYFLGRWIRHCGWYPDYRQPQLFNRTKMRYRDELVHESFALQGKLGRLREHVIQIPWPTVEAATAKLHRYSTLMAQRYHQMNHRATLARMVASPLAMALKLYVLRQGFRDGYPGLLVTLLYAYYTFLKYAKLWELQQRTGAR